MKIYNLSFENAKEILKKLDEKFGLVYTRNKTAATGKTISAIIRKQDSRLYFVDIHSNFFVNSTILEAIPEYDDEYFLNQIQ